MASLNLTSTGRGERELRAQNIQVAAGQVGQQPVPKGQQFQLTITTLGRLAEPEQFGDIIVKVGQGGPAGAQAAQTNAFTPISPGSPSGSGNPGLQPSGSGQSGTAATVVGQAASIVRLRDIARIELGAQQYDQSATLDGHPSVALSVYQLPGTNALDTAKGVYAKMAELKKRFPDGLKYEIVYDTTPFIRESVLDVVWTLLEAIGLVAA